MIVRDEDLNRFVGKGDDFESLINDLILAESWACGIAQDQIDWDYRTNVPDGGRDVSIMVGNQRADRQFIPPVKSVWSMKSGADGLESGTLRREINGHPKVISH